MKFNTNHLIRLASLVMVLNLASCAGTYRHSIDFNPSEPLRIAVLPFVSVDGSGKIIAEESRLLIDNLSLVSSKQEDTPAQTVRRLVNSELKNSGLDLVSSALIDIDLPHHGFAKADGSLDTPKLHSLSAQEICTHLLNCDAVLYGQVTKWNRHYYGIETVNTVGIRLKLVSARTGKDIFNTEAEDSESRGLTKIPTGISSVVLEPIKGLDSDIIVGLAGNVVKKMLAPIDIKARPEFLESAPPSIYASSHDGPSGYGNAKDGDLSKAKSLVVVMFGTDKQLASFSIGKSISDIPMIERNPGHYYGEYVPLPGDHFSNQPVTVALADSFGRKSIQTISKPAVSFLQ